MQMRVLVPVALLLASVTLLAAHPGVGIVMDSRGNVFYTDLKQVWKIAPDGSKSVAVPGVHTHELVLDPNDNLFGEHLWYEGEATDRWGHRVWRLSPEGTLTDLIPARRGFLDDYEDFHFVRDARGNMYWTIRGASTVIRRRSPDGATTTVAGADFKDVRWMTARPDGTLHLIDLYDLVRVTGDGKVETIARDLPERSWWQRLSTNRHAVMGLWTDPQGDVFVAVNARGVVKKVSPDGQVHEVARSPFPWSPTGGLVAPNGDLWLLEYSFRGARARRIQADGKSTEFD